MIVAITDANIFIDLEELGLLSLLFQLPINVNTTFEVLIECDRALKDKLRQLSKENVLHIYMLADENWTEMNQIDFSKGLSNPDKSVLYLALKRSMLVLSGDNLVRKWCLKHQLEVHGILWVLDQFVKKQLLLPHEAIQKMELLLQINSWLPIRDCMLLVERWRKGL